MVGAETNSKPVRTRTFRRGNVQWMVRADDDVSAHETIFREPDAELAQHQPFRDTILVTLARIPGAMPGGKSYLLRRTNYGKPMARVRDFFRTAAPIRAFRNALELEAAGIPTPRVIAAGIVRKLQKPICGYLLVEEISGASSLVDYIKAHHGVPHRTIKEMAQVITHLHEKGIIHGDLTIGNVLLDAHLKIWLVDLDRLKTQSRAVNWRGAVEDFFRFARHIPVLGPGARFGALRLLKAYCALRGWAGREREFSADVLERLKQKVKGYGSGVK